VWLGVRACEWQSLIAEGGEGEDDVLGRWCWCWCWCWGGGEKEEGIPDVGDGQVNVSPLTAVRRQTPSRRSRCSNQRPGRIAQQESLPMTTSQVNATDESAELARRCLDDASRVRVRGGLQAARHTEQRLARPHFNSRAGWPSCFGERRARCTVTCANGSFLLPSTIKRADRDRRRVPWRSTGGASDWDGRRAALVQKRGDDRLSLYRRGLILDSK
jgi:hypothetical protein